jgi:hypothetical protein
LASPCALFKIHVSRYKDAQKGQADSTIFPTPSDQRLLESSLTCSGVPWISVSDIRSGNKEGAPYCVRLSIRLRVPVAPRLADFIRQSFVSQPHESFSLIS